MKGKISLVFVAVIILIAGIFAYFKVYPLRSNINHAYSPDEISSNDKNITLRNKQYLNDDNDTTSEENEDLDEQNNDNLDDDLDNNTKINSHNPKLNSHDNKSNTIEGNNAQESAGANSNTFKNNEDIINIALFGIDCDDKNSGRSDCIVILSIDKKNSKIKLSSLIRDSYVTIPNRQSKDKLNHAYAFGGPDLALETINNNFGLNITNYISVNFSSFPKVIDEIGGLEINLQDDELKYINRYIDSLNSLNNTNSPNIRESGTQTLDGIQSLAYIRIRYTDGGDFERTHRQRLALTSLYKKLLTLSPLEYPKVLKDGLSLVKTNMDYSDLISLVQNLDASKYSIVEDRFPQDEDGKGQLIHNIYYYVFDEEKTTEKINDFIYGN